MEGNPACTEVSDKSSHWPWQGRASATACACGGMLCKRADTLWAYLLTVGLWRGSLRHTRNVLKYSWGARAHPEAKPHTPAVVHRHVVTSFCVTSELEQLYLRASHKSVPRQRPCLPQGTRRGLGLLVWFWLGDFFFFWSFFTFVWISLKVGELLSFILFPK